MARLMLLLLMVAPMILISQAATFQKTSSKHGKDFIQRVKVNTRMQSETIHLQRASTGEDAGDIVYDFDKNVTMIRVPEAKSCFLKDSTANAPRPADLQKLLDTTTDVTLTPQALDKLKIVGKLNDRSILSDEMADLCANHPIYRVTEVDQKDADQMSDPGEANSEEGPKMRRKRGCRWSCAYNCSGWSCSYDCSYRC